jgi:excisionase family DNA binding protein
MSETTVVPHNPDPRLTIEQASGEANVSAHTIRRAYNNGHLTVIRFGVGGRGLRIKRSELMKWMDAGGRTDEQQTAAAAAVRVSRR